MDYALYHEWNIRPSHCLSGHLLLSYYLHLVIQVINTPSTHYLKLNNPPYCISNKALSFSYHSAYPIHKQTHIHVFAYIIYPPYDFILSILIIFNKAGKNKERNEDFLFLFIYFVYTTNSSHRSIYCLLYIFIRQAYLFLIYVAQEVNSFLTFCRAHQ